MPENIADIPRRNACPDGTKVSSRAHCVVSSELTDLPSGSGKTTLINVLAHRAPTANATIQQTLAINGAPTSLASFRKLSSYVEQEDALVGSLTVCETLHFAAQLALPRYGLPSR
jgi:ABC-type iron transport system FetAB ATPase subunit